MSIWFKTLDAIAARAIEENPISDLVDTLRRVLEAEYKAVNKATTPSIDFFVEFVSSASPASRSRNLLRDFLAKLVFSPVPGLLFLDPSDTLESAIYRFLSELPKTPQIDLKYSRGLATLLSVIVTDTEQVIDAIVWEALLNIFVESPNLPPTPKTSRLQTPVKGISSSHCRDTETHRDMDPRIRAELDGLVYPDTPLFLETYFLSQHWTHISDSTFQAVSSSISHGKGWQTWPPEPEQNAVLNWFSTFVNGLVSSTNRQYGGSPNKPLGESTTKRKPDIFLYKPLKTLGEETRNSFNWSDILVVDELKKSCESTLSPSLIVELANYVRLVFDSQHSRRFVHAFTLCGDLMRYWIFHRGGAIGSTLFSINEKPDLFISVIMGYALMDMTQLGYGPTVIAGPTGSYVTIPLSDGRRQKFLLAPIPFFTSNSIASRGTTFHRAIGGNRVSRSDDSCTRGK